jgi:hypothetical protein
VASGYTLYSSATVAVVTLGGGRVASFTLDQATGEFLTTQPDLRIPNRGDSPSGLEQIEWSLAWVRFLTIAGMLGKTAGAGQSAPSAVRSSSLTYLNMIIIKRSYPCDPSTI